MKKGVRYIVTRGEYSDYGILDSFVCLQSFSFDKALAEWIKKYGDDGKFGWHGAPNDAHAFLSSLRAAGLVADEKLNQVHVADDSEPATDPAKDADDEPTTKEPR